VDKVKIGAAVAVILAGLAAYYQLSEMSVLLRTGMIIVALAAGAGLFATTEQGRALVGFAGGARNEVRKVIWPTRRETVQATLVVIVMVLVVGIYIWILDAIAFWAVYDLILNVRS
jgi:preprotein translocase subunit SecE